MSVKVCVSVDCGSPVPTGGGEKPESPTVSTYSTLIGDGENVSFTVSHALDSLNVVPTIRNTLTGVIHYDPVVTVVDVNTIRVEFPAPPGMNEYSVHLLSVAD